MPYIAADVEMYSLSFHQLVLNIKKCICTATVFLVTYILYSSIELLCPIYPYFYYLDNLSMLNISNCKLSHYTWKWKRVLDIWFIVFFFHMLCLMRVCYLIFLMLFFHLLLFVIRAFWKLANTGTMTLRNMDLLQWEDQGSLPRNCQDKMRPYKIQNRREGSLA